jgi:plasmid maintenance system antidote protein VapI
MSSSGATKLVQIRTGKSTIRAQSAKIAEIGEALRSLRIISLDAQAKALGVHRSTAWTIVRKKHKLGRLSAKTIKRILANPGTPGSVLSLIHQYLAERSDSVHACGQAKAQLTISTSRQEQTRYQRRANEN